MTLHAAEDASAADQPSSTTTNTARSSPAAPKAQSLRTIARGTGISLAVVHRVTTEHETQNHSEPPETASEPLPAN
ncbi:hypothetical protein [Nocardioides panzhihuensis]|uniref:Uncharacterized protein n=1 Tax=Nocardioides panzhihuensis TaxID=860243 RepID=A0A7Z0DT88_9ACTN|nr:hypothetical protein [Nocardioides panzhihuensis]NYI81248.1 hypothetical protein [Nocardioides panzhihuensis]